MSSDDHQSWVDVGDYALHWGGSTGPPSLVIASAREATACIPLINAEAKLNATTPELSIGVHLHAYYLEACAAILATLRRSIPRCRMLITTDSAAKQTSIESLLQQSLEGTSPAEGWSTKVLVTPNQGRNVLPLLRHGWGELRQCELVLHVHTKQSPHQSFGDAWGRELISSLAGTATVVQSVMEAFEAEPQLGMVIPRPSEAIRPYLHWGANFEWATWISNALWPDRLLNLEAPLAFPAGMMLWFRPSALEPLIAAEPLLRNPPEEPLLDDGTSLHALERLSLHACEVAGYSWRYVNPNWSQTATSPATAAPATCQSKLSVWQPQPIAYRAGVAALAQRHRQLQTQHAAMESQMHAMESQMHAMESQMLAMEEQAGIQETQFREALAALQEQERIRETQSTEVQAALREHLATAEASNHQLRGELQALRHSLSWRLTGPLRRLRQLGR